MPLLVVEVALISLYFISNAIANRGNIPGTGLGVSISNEIVRLLNGDIEVDSQMDYGTTTTVWLPENYSHEATEYQSG